MRWMKLLVLLWLGAALAARAESAKIVKVLPHFLDEKGRHALKPSLYERDAYQLHLRKNPQLRSALRFDLLWKSATVQEVKLRLEVRGSLDGQVQQATLEKTFKQNGLFGNWCSVALEGDAYKKFGELTAWRATLWSGDKQLAEQKSFLW